MGNLDNKSRIKDDLEALTWGLFYVGGYGTTRCYLEAE